MPQPVKQNCLHTEIAQGIHAFSLPLRNGILLGHVYLVHTSKGWIAIDAGPAALASQLLKEISQLCPLSDIQLLVALDSSTSGNSALSLWRSHGFLGPVFGEWRTIIELEAAGHPGPYSYLYKHHCPITIGDEPLLECITLPQSPGFVFVAHPESGALFTGCLASSMGQNLPPWADTNHPGQLSYTSTFPTTTVDIPTLLRDFTCTIQSILPRYGSFVRNFGSTVNPSPPKEMQQVPLVTPQDIQDLMRQVDTLKHQNIDLQAAMIETSDAALRDSKTGLYGKTYAEKFIESLMANATEFCCSHIRLDKAKELNRTLGPEGTDEILSDLGIFLQDQLSIGFLFKWSGPAFMLITEGNIDSVYETLESLRLSIKAEKRFARPITVSIALTASNELESTTRESPVDRLQHSTATRLRILDKSGGNGVCKESISSNDTRYTALVLDGNYITCNFLTEYLTSKGFYTIGETSGGKALERMDQFTPEVVIADLFLPQFDAFQLRHHMNASTDLKNIPFILIVPHKTDQIIERAHNNGIFYIFERPLHTAELIGLIQHLIARTDYGN